MNNPKEALQNAGRAKERISAIKELPILKQDYYECIPTMIEISETLNLYMSRIENEAQVALDALEEVRQPERDALRMIYVERREITECAGMMLYSIDGFNKLLARGLKQMECQNATEATPVAFLTK